LRGAVTLLVCAYASAVGAETSGTASLLSDYRYRGMTLSDGKPAAQLGLGYDDPLGWYAGVFGSTVRLPEPTAPGLQGMGFAGFASRLAEGVSVEIGGDYSVFTGAAAYDYGEVYLGVASDNLSARIYYSPRYFGGPSSSVYGELNGAQPLFERIRLLGHVGLLATRSVPAYGPRPHQQIVDGKVGVLADIHSVQVELAWVGISHTYSAYPTTGSNRRNSVVLTLSLAF